MIRSGFVKIAIAEGTWERVVTYLGPGKHFGELAFLAELNSYLPGDADHAPDGKTVDDLLCIGSSGVVSYTRG